MTLGAWLRAEADRVTADQRRMADQARAIEPQGGRYTPAQQVELADLRYDYTLPTAILVTSVSPARLGVLASWLDRAKRKLVHGAELYDICADHGVHLGPADLDRLVYVAHALDLVRPYDYDPRPGTYTEWSTGLLKPAEQRAWRQHGRLPSGLAGEPGPLAGVQFWYWTRGQRFGELR